MKSTDINTSLIDHYYSLLKSLSPNNKLELIVRLSKSMKSSMNNNDASWKSLFGALIIDKSTEDFIQELYLDRLTGINIEDWTARS